MTLRTGTRIACVNENYRTRYVGILTESVEEGVYTTASFTLEGGERMRAEGRFYSAGEPSTTHAEVVAGMTERARQMVTGDGEVLDKVNFETPRGTLEIDTVPIRTLPPGPLYVVIDTSNLTFASEICLLPEAAKPIATKLNARMKSEFQSFTVATIIFDPEV